jgi:hypothetical protein
MYVLHNDHTQFYTDEYIETKAPLLFLTLKYNKHQIMVPIYLNHNDVFFYRWLYYNNNKHFDVKNDDKKIYLTNEVTETIGHLDLYS